MSLTKQLTYISGSGAIASSTSYISVRCRTGTDREVRPQGNGIHVHEQAIGPQFALQPIVNAPGVARDELIPTHITLRSELNELEQQNIGTAEGSKSRLYAVAYRVSVRRSRHTFGASRRGRCAPACVRCWPCRAVSVRHVPRKGEIAESVAAKPLSSALR
jgi:hypothetical protein